MKEILTFQEHIEPDNVCKVKVRWEPNWFERLGFVKVREEEYLVDKSTQINIRTGRKAFEDSRFLGDRLVAFCWAQLVLIERHYDAST